MALMRDARSGRLATHGGNHADHRPVGIRPGPVPPARRAALGTIKAAQVGAFWMKLYSYAWFVGFGIAFAVYAALTLGGTRAGRAAPGSGGAVGA